MPLPTLDQLSVEGKRVFVRADLNVPLENNKIKDPTRIEAVLPTIQELLDKGAIIIVGSHLGRPKGPTKSLSLAPIAEYLAKRLQHDVFFVPEVVGETVKKAVKALKPREILVLENLRFEAGERKGDQNLAKTLCSYADIYVNDAFGTAHRKDVSTYYMALHFKEKAVGRLMEKEVEVLSKLLEDPAQPFLAIIGGAKISDKLGVIDNLLERVHTLILGGALANTFLLARGYQVGKSKVEKNMIREATNIMARAQAKRVMLRIPKDAITAESPEAQTAYPMPINDIPLNHMILDIGPQTIKKYINDILKAKTIFWNGPMGVFEMELFRQGTFKVAEAVAQSAAYSVIGGGESVSAVKEAGVADKISHISTGGGASLYFLAGKSLPALEAISK